jgi:hypothetical protein
MKDTSHTVILHLLSDICINFLQHNYLAYEPSGTGVRHYDLHAFKLFCSSVCIFFRRDFYFFVPSVMRRLQGNLN